MHYNAHFTSTVAWLHQTVTSIWTCKHVFFLNQSNYDQILDFQGRFYSAPRRHTHHLDRTEIELERCDITNMAAVERHFLIIQQWIQQNTTELTGFWCIKAIRKCDTEFANELHKCKISEKLKSTLFHLDLWWWRSNGKSKSHNQ